MAVSRLTRLLAAGALVASTAVVLTALPASATDVGDETALRAAFGDAAETSIVLTADIDLTDCVAGDLTRPAAAVALTLSGAFTIRQTCADQRVIGSDADVGALTVEDVTVTGGRLTDAVSATGGGISWDGDVTLTRATVTDNSATAPFGGLGGGLFLTGEATVFQSTLSDNTAGSNGDFGGLAGALSAGSGSTVTESVLAGNTAEGGADFGGTGGALFSNGNEVIERSTVTGNVAQVSDDGISGGNGGGIVTNGSLTVTNSTITGNTATGTTSSNGGLAAGGDMLIAYSTVVGNSAAAAANLQTLSNDPEFSSDLVFGTVIADPLGGGTNCGTPSDAAASQGYNYATDDSCNLTATGDRQSAADPQLGTLADNGGPTPTLLPATASPLLNFIPPASCQTGIATGVTTDQRSITRPQGAGCDIGAVEVQVFPPSSSTTSSTTPGGSSTSTAPIARPFNNPTTSALPLVTPRFTG